jgi:hypothetical protein
MGSGGPRGLQNRSGLTTSGWVGSIPTRSRHRAAALLLPLLLAVPAAAASAQRADSARAGVSREAALRADSAERAGSPRTPSARAAGATADTLAPPISPRRAFLYSFLLPGAGQARLDRLAAGGSFFLAEVAALVFVHRAAEDLRIARAFPRDSVPLRYQVDAVTGLVARAADGTPIVAAWSAPRYDEGWVRTRRLHYEDWLAVLVFNHLFAGADAFVAAQLWDLPGKVALRQAPFGPLLVSVTLPFR